MGFWVNSYFSVFTYFIKLMSFFLVVSNRDMSSFSDSIKFNLFEIKICVSSSLNDPNDMYRNCRFSLLPFLAAPSAILEGTEIAALRI